MSSSVLQVIGAELIFRQLLQFTELNESNEDHDETDRRTWKFIEKEYLVSAFNGNLIWVPQPS